MTGTSCRQQRLIQGELKFIYRESTVLVAVFRGQADLFMETPEKYSSLDIVKQSNYPLLD
jgi:hypothetical protein